MQQYDLFAHNSCLSKTTTRQPSVSHSDDRIYGKTLNHHLLHAASFIKQDQSNDKTNMKAGLYNGLCDYENLNARFQVVLLKRDWNLGYWKKRSLTNTIVDILR